VRCAGECSVKTDKLVDRDEIESENQRTGLSARGVTATGGYGSAVTDYELVGTPPIPLDVLLPTTAVRAAVEFLL